MLVYGKISKVALSGVHLSAVGEQTIAYNPFGISGKLGAFRIISSCSITQPDTSFLIQILVFKTIDVFMNMNTFAHDPVDDI